MQTPDDEILALLIGEFLDQQNAGKSPDLASFLSQCPEAKRAELQEAVGFVASAGKTPAATPPKRFGDFELLRELGRGGMGVVYEARQISVDRRVALKILSPWAGNDETARTRLEREAQALAKLRHPGIVTVFATGEHEGTRYFVMDLVPGKTLDQILADAKSKGARVATRQTLGWMREIADALAYAHRAGIVHRDVKPSNIRITSEGKAMLLDFGLARDAAKDTLTMTGAFQGSPFYAPPEQIRGHREQIDARADVYSLGVTLYECVAGCLPFHGETAEQIFQLVLHADPVKPRFWNPTISADLETVILCAIDKDPQRRYATAGEMAEDLRRCLEDLPIFARPDTILFRLQRLAHRRRAGILAAALLLAAGAATWSTVRHYMGIAEQQAARAEQLESKSREAAKNIPLEPPAASKTPVPPQDPTPVATRGTDDRLLRGRQAKELFEAAATDFKLLRNEKAIEKMLRVDELMDQGVDPAEFAPINQLLSYHRLAEWQRTNTNGSLCDAFLIKGETILATVDASRLYPADETKFFATYCQGLESLFAKKGETPKARYFGLKGRAFQWEKPMSATIARSAQALDLHVSVPKDFQNGKIHEVKTSLLRIATLVEEGVDERIYPQDFALGSLTKLGKLRIDDGEFDDAEKGLSLAEKIAIKELEKDSNPATIAGARKVYEALRLLYSKTANAAKAKEYLTRLKELGM